MKRYNPKEIEPKWQKFWDETGTYTADLQSDKPKYIAMSMFNYPSGAGIHIGHAMNYTISDVKARFKRQQGYESYHPVGWDAFGLPAENFAIKSGVSPQVSMANIIPGYHKQYKAMGWSNDWEKEISTHLPEYYKWTQWIFTQMHKHGLAYKASRMQWWCAIDNTVLANEQVIDGKCWRHDGPDDPLVEKKEVQQWFFKITDYADELLDAIDDLDWTESVKLAQKNWIGKSVGAEIDFQIADTDEKLTVFTTRPDTLFGATFMVLAPEHELVGQITTAEQKAEIDKYIKAAEKKSEVERQASKEKTGVFTGAYAINPINDEKIPICVADYVLGNYGTGAIMAVPAHDERDNEFARTYDLPIRQVVAERFVHEGNEHHPEAPLVPRQVICAVVKHPTEDKYLIAKPHGSEFWSPVMGGIDDGETATEAAIRELLEESGYHDIASVELCGDIIASEFYAQHKRANRIAYIQTVKIQLATLDKQPDAAIDQNEQDLKWATKEEVRKFCIGAGAQEVYEMADGSACPMTFEGRLINSGKFNGQPTSEARESITDWLAEKKLGKEKVNYRMNDWSVGRQRYWGAPIPVINCPKCGPVLVPEEDLPVVLPELEDFKPSGDGRSALARATDWLKAPCPQCGGEGERETDTLDTYICSSWYFLRYFDPHNQQAAFGSDVANKWMPIDFYNGADHATAHMLYARFVTRFFNKIGLLSEPEPFKQFLFNGKVTAHDGTMFSKSKGNGVDPLEIIEQGYGADALRTYLMFASPLDLWTRWDPQGVPGTYRFLNRLWNLVQEYVQGKGQRAEGEEQADEILRSVHPMIKKVTEDLEENRYNTAIAAQMACLNELYKLKEKGFGSEAWQFALESMVACVAPFAPHIAEELWEALGHSLTVHRDSWPKWEEKYLVSDTITIVAQVNGKVRAQLQLAPDSNEDQVVEAAKADTKVQQYLEAKEIIKTIYVPNKLINFVAK